jgi:hypothetical protein
MATGRTSLRNWRAYVDGYDLSGYTRSFGPLSCTFEEGVDDAITLMVKATMIGSATVSIGTLNGIFDNTATSGIHAVMKTVGVSRCIMFPCGIQSAPIDNDPVFVGKFTQLGYYAAPEELPVHISIPFGGTVDNAGNTAYARPWGTLLRAKAVRTSVSGANTAVGLDQLAETEKGGYMAYQVFAGNGTATLSVEHSTTTNEDAEFSSLIDTGTGGSIKNFSTPKAGIVQLPKDTTVGQFVRWQIAFGSATTVTFALAFVRGN